MSSKTVIPRARALLDVKETIDYYLAEATEEVAIGFIDALEHAYAHIADHPASCSRRCAYELDLPGLLVWPLRNYPHLIFYVERTDHLDVWRVLHSKRDIPAWLQHG